MTKFIHLSAAELDIATRVLNGEAGAEPLEGKVAVAWVMRNRTTWAHPWWGSTILDVCEKKEQFSCLNGDANTRRIMSLDPRGWEYQAAQTVVKSVMAGDIPDPTNGATTYKVRGTPAMWDAAVDGFTPISIGKHDFWKLSPDGHCLPFDGVGGTDGATS